MREIQSMYDVSFVKLSERFFKGQPWPPVEAISELVDHDHVFCMLYKVSGPSEWTTVIHSSTSWRRALDFQHYDERRTHTACGRKGADAVGCGS